MLLSSFNDLRVPTNEIYDRLNYKNIRVRDKLNLIIKNKKVINTFDDDIDNIVLNALNYYDNLNTFVIFGKDKSVSYKYFVDNFKEDYILYGIKHLELNASMIPKILYQLLFSRMIIKNKSDLNDTIKFLCNYTEKMINITVLFVCKRDITKKYPKCDVIQDDLYIYIPNTKEEIWNISTIFFSSSTLKFLNIQNFDYFLTKDMEKSKSMFLKYRKWLNTNVEGKYQPQFMLFSSVILYLLGHRAMNDLDLYIHTIPTNIQERLEEFKTNEVFNFIDFKIKNTDNWPNYWDTWLDEWAQKCGAKYFEEILGNPKYHFYFLGVKIISLECDVERRLCRNRPRAFADLIALRKRYAYDVIIPRIPITSTEYNDITKKTPSEIAKLISEGGILNEVNKEVCITRDIDQVKFMSTIIYALHTRYRMTFTVDDIKRELNMLSREDKRIKIVIKKA